LKFADLSIATTRVEVILVTSRLETILCQWSV